MKEAIEDGKRVILYARVSTRRQAQEGFSLEQQLERLREYAAQEGYEVVEECRDPGYGGAKLERPGLDRVRDRVAIGGVDIVLAQDRDRFSRDPDQLSILRYEFAKHGCKLRALSDRGDGTPQGDFQDGILEQVAKYERALTMERTRRNKRKKAREGKVVGGPSAAFGYDWLKNEDGKIIGYVVDESEMHVVRRIFTEIAGGVGIRRVKEKLDTEQIRTPGGGKAWSRPFIKSLALNDLYRPHTVEELAEAGISAEVLRGLDPERPYGVYRFDDILVPIPDAGIPLEVVEAARHKVLNNRSPSKSGDRFWQLSGGILVCAECERRMQPLTTTPRSISYYYYRCQTTHNGSADRCGMRTHVRADVVEAEVWEAVSLLLDDKHYLLEKVEEYFAARRAEFSRPGADAVTLGRQLGEIEKRWVKWQQAYEADAISVADLAAHRAELDNEREAVERELERVRNREEELERLAETESVIRKRIEATENLDGMTPQEKRELYEDLRLRVEVGEDKRPLITGVFPTGRTENGTHTLYVSRLETSPTWAGRGTTSASLWRR